MCYICPLVSCPMHLLLNSSYLDAEILFTTSYRMLFVCSIVEFITNPVFALCGKQIIINGITKIIFGLFLGTKSVTSLENQKHIFKFLLISPFKIK